jgi:hypothetical protein
MKSLRQYLQDKYGLSNATAITRAEAIVMGVPYPLQTGWLRKYGDLAVTDRLEAQLLGLCKLSRHQRNAAARKLKKDGAGKIYPDKRIYEAGDDFLQSFEWRRVRMQVLQERGRRCEACGADALKHGVRIHVDHIKPRTLYPQLALDKSNLQVLCEECNHGKGNWDMTDWHAKIEA